MSAFVLLLVMCIGYVESMCRVAYMHACVYRTIVNE